MITWPLLFAALGCYEYPQLNSSPPGSPIHDNSQDGSPHARGLVTPFLCNEGQLLCPDDVRPEQANLSCDASGCHGDAAFEPGAGSERHLFGSDGPSCYTCHDQFWSDRKEPR